MRSSIVATTGSNASISAEWSRSTVTTCGQITSASPLRIPRRIPAAQAAAFTASTLPSAPIAWPGSSGDAPGLRSGHSGYHTQSVRAIVLHLDRSGHPSHGFPRCRQQRPSPVDPTVTVRSPAPGDLLCFEGQMCDTGRHRSAEGSQQQGGPPIPGERRELSDRCVLRPCRDLCKHRRSTVEESSNSLPPPNNVPTTGNHQSVGFDANFPCSNRAEPSTHIEVGDGSRSGVTGEHDQPQPCHPKPCLTGKYPDLTRSKRWEIKSPVPSLRSPVRTPSSTESEILLAARSSQLVAGDWRLATGDSLFSCHSPALLSRAGDLPGFHRRSAGYTPYRTYVRFTSAVP